MMSDFEPPWSRIFEEIMKLCMTSDFESPWWVHQKTLARASNQAAAATAPGSSATTLTFFIHKGVFFSNIPPDFQCQISQPELLSPKNSVQNNSSLAGQVFVILVPKIGNNS